MRLVTFDLGSSSNDAPSETSARIEDIRLAVAILAGAVSVAEAELASSTRAATKKILRACRAFEAAVAAPPAAAVNMAHIPSPATLKTIAAVSAVSACLPSLEVLKAIDAVVAANGAFERGVRGDAVAEIHQSQETADLRQFAIERDPRDAVFEPFSNL